MRFSDVSGLTMRSVDVDGLDIDSHDLFFGRLLVNGVDVVPLVDAELDRQFPGRELQKSDTIEGLRAGWVAVQAAWRETVDGTPREQWDAHVPDEWSLARTLRHLVLATDAWLGRGVNRVEQPFHEIGQQVTDFLATAAPQLLAEQRDNPWGGGDWRPTVGDCIRVILEEEWAHLRYVRRDLALLG